MPLNHGFNLVIWCSRSQLHFGVFTVKFSLNSITAQNIANLGNTVRCLKIILLSLFFLLIFSASTWRPYGRNLANTREDKKTTNLQSTITRLSIFLFFQLFQCLSSNRSLERHFRVLTVKLRFIHRFSMAYLCLSCKQHFEVFTVKFSP